MPNLILFLDPGSPESVDILAINTTSVEVEWFPPEAKNGILGDYTIFWQAEEDQYFNTATVDNTTTSYIISHLQSCVLYNINVTAATSAGAGEPASDYGTPQSEGKIQNMY